MTLVRSILPSILPGTIVAVAYFFIFGYRFDYLGHYAAGYGGTLTALAVAVDSIPSERFKARSPLYVVAGVVICICGGVFTEATLFNIAKFDEVDFCNQSIGAVLAGIGFLVNVGIEKPDKTIFRTNIYAGLIALHLGFYFAMF